MHKFFDKQNNRLVFVGKKTSPCFWNTHWEIFDLKENIATFSKYNFVVRVTKKCLRPEGGPILEGGCGIGQNVYALTKCGFRCIGVDYAKKTVAKVNEFVPYIEVRYGDVRKLEFEDSYFAAYWSLGVIEHFYNGYDEIVLEMKRVLKNGGYLFCTFPYLSPLRIFKAKLRFYPLFNNTTPDDFYQYAFDYKVVLKDLKKIGFVLKYKKALGGVKGFKDEISPVKNRLQKLYDYKGNSLLLRGLRFSLNRALSFFAGHMMLLVLRLEK